MSLVTLNSLEHIQNLRVVNKEKTKNKSCDVVSWSATFDASLGIHSTPNEQQSMLVCVSSV